MTKVWLSPLTGRRHQLRQHCAGLGCPIIGDDLYHSAACLSDESKRWEAIDRISALEDKDDSEDEDNDLMSLDKELSETQNASIPFDQQSLTYKVRKGVGLLLMSTSIEFTHPFPKLINTELITRKDNHTTINFDEDLNRFSVKINELNKFRSIFEKAGKGASFSEDKKRLIIIN
jgi:23S rRNA-/tRNA-specific pseudouridylate synthase